MSRRRKSPFRAAVPVVVKMADPADLFPMKGGKVNPSFVGLFDTSDPTNVVPKTDTVNRQLRDRGLAPLRWKGTRNILREHGIKVERHNDAEVLRADVPGQEDGGSLTWWAPRWAVLLAEADPLNDTARSWALARSQIDADFQAALDAFATLANSEHARRKMADFVMDAWEP